MRTRVDFPFKAGTPLTRRFGLALIALALTSCGLFKPKHQPGAATTTQAGDVTVDFQGVTGFTEADLRDALFDPLDTIQHDGLRPATADDVAFFLELFYRKNGYAFVSTSYTILNPKHLVLKVDEGPLVVLGDIRFTGNEHYKDVANFQQYIIGQTRERFPSSRKDLPYVDTDVQKGRRSRAAFLPLRRLSQRAGRHTHGRVRQRPHARESDRAHRRGRALPLRRGEHRRRTRLPARAGARPHR